MLSKHKELIVYNVNNGQLRFRSTCKVQKTMRDCKHMSVSPQNDELLIPVNYVMLLTESLSFPLPSSFVLTHSPSPLLTLYFPSVISSENTAQHYPSL